MPVDGRSGPGAETRSPRTAVVWAVLYAELAGRGEPALSIVDVGGGSGGFAVPLAQLGHRVTVIDPSPDALATLNRRALAGGVGDRIIAVQGDTDTLVGLVPGAGADLVLCHSLLEVVDDPGATLRVLAEMLCARGCLSILVANRVAAVLSRALAGQFAKAERALHDPEGRWGAGDGTTRRFDLDRIARLVAATGLVVEQVHGVRVVADLVPGSVLDGAGEALIGVELALAATPPYRDIATQLHVLARKR